MTRTGNVATGEDASLCERVVCRQLRYPVNGLDRKLCDPPLRKTLTGMRCAYSVTGGYDNPSHPRVTFGTALSTRQTWCQPAR